MKLEVFLTVTYVLHSELLFEVQQMIFMYAKNMKTCKTYLSRFKK